MNLSYNYYRLSIYLFAFQEYFQHQFTVTVVLAICQHEVICLILLLDSNCRLLPVLSCMGRKIHHASLNCKNMCLCA